MTVPISTWVWIFALAAAGSAALDIAAVTVAILVELGHEHSHLACRIGRLRSILASPVAASGNVRLS